MDEENQIHNPNHSLGIEIVGTVIQKLVKTEQGYSESYNKPSRPPVLGQFETFSVKKPKFKNRNLKNIF